MLIGSYVRWDDRSPFFLYTLIFFMLHYACDVDRVNQTTDFEVFTEVWTTKFFCICIVFVTERPFPETTENRRTVLKCVVPSCLTAYRHHHHNYAPFLKTRQNRRIVLNCTLFSDLHFMYHHHQEQAFSKTHQ